MINFLQMSYKTWREYWGYTQKEVAKALKITENTYAMIERGERNPGGAVIELLNLLKIDHTVRQAKLGQGNRSPSQ